ncbi:MAG: alpha/beta fold hydrolase [Bacteroidia bacterium]
MNKHFSYPYTVKYCDIGNKINIAYGEFGSGQKTILFIHGLAGYGLMWYANALELSKKHKCIVIDLPGNGLSSRGDYPYTMFFYAECVARFIEKLELKNLILAGHSMGGHVSIVCALRYGHLLDKLVLVAPSGFEHFNEAEKLIFKNLLSLGSIFISDKLSLKTALDNSFFSKNNEWLKTNINQLYDIIDYYGSVTWQQMVKANIFAMLDEQVSMFLPYLDLPVLVIFGKNDALIPVKAIHTNTNTERLAKQGSALIPNCKLILIENCGHLAQIEKADEVNTAILNFCESK